MNIARVELSRSVQHTMLIRWHDNMCDSDAYESARQYYALSGYDLQYDITVAKYTLPENQITFFLLYLL
jgi:hypothetical protein